MIWFIAILNFFLNYCYGAMIIVLPQLNLEAAGLAFSMFFLFKALWYFAAAGFNDKFGEKMSIALSLLLQALALFFVFKLPNYPWVGRILEGVALAQGTVSSITLMRLSANESSAFSRAMSLVMALGSVGFVIGPVSAFFVTSTSIQIFGDVLISSSLIFLMAWVFWPVKFKKENLRKTISSEPSLLSPRLVWAIIAVACIKSVVMGLQLNLGWWTKNLLALSPLLSGLSFLLLSLAFAMGATVSRFLPRVAMAAAGLIAYVILEYALFGHLAAWWFSLGLMGFWYGVSVTVFYAKLGWSNEAASGQQNAKWLFFVDAPMAILPILLWPTRADLASVERISLVVVLLILSSIGYLRVFGLDFRVPTKSSQA